MQLDRRADREASAEIVGRDDELAALAWFLDSGATDPNALLIAGEAGIGKTALWQAAVAEARRTPYLVLSCRPVEAEAKLSYTALADLLRREGGDLLQDAAGQLPAPQRRAIEVALLLDDGEGGAPDERALAVAFLNVLRVLAASQRVLVAIDDFQWLDAPSAAVMEFAARRLTTERVKLVLAIRADGVKAGGSFVRSMAEERLALVQLKPLSEATIFRLVRQRLGFALPRTTLLDVYEASGGNPFFCAGDRPRSETPRRLVARPPALRPARPRAASPGQARAPVRRCA